MARVKIALWLTIGIMIYSTCTLFILNYQNNKFKDIVEQVQILYDSGDRQAALEKSNELNDAWHRYERAVTVIVHDDHLQQLNVSVARITPLLANDSDELTAEIQSIYHELDQIYESEFPTWYNIL